MNRADVALLDNQLDELGNTFLRNRQMEAEKKFREQEANAATLRANADLEFRKAQQQHYSQIEDKQADANQRMADQAAAARKQALFTSVVGLNATGQLTEDARNDFNDWLAGDDHFGPTGLQIGPPDPSLLKGGSKDAAVVNALKNASQYRNLAEQQTDPEKKAEFNSYADKLEGWVGKQGTFKPAEGFEETTTKPQIDPITGKQTGTNTSVKRRVPIAAPGVAPVSTGTGVPPAPQNPTQRQAGQHYQTPKGTFLWDGSQWQSPTAAAPATPSQAVPGFGSAQP